VATVKTEPGYLTTAGVKTREAVLSDYARIAALAARNGLDKRTREEWEHLWVDNPVYKKLPKWPIGWVAENDNEIVGYFGNIPLNYRFKGRDIVGSSLYSTSLDAPFRGHAILLIKRFLRWSHSVEYMVCTTANASSSKLIEATRAPHPPAGDWGNSVFWITNYDGFLAGALQKKGLPKWLAYPASATLMLRDKLTKPRSWMNQQSQLETCSGFDQRFDVFWEELKNTYPGRLLSDRSCETLQWHFKYALIQKRVWILAFMEGARIAAYSIFYRHDNRDINLKRVRLIDFQVLNGDSKILVPMLAWALRRCQEEGIHMLEAYGFRPDKQHVIDSLAPYRRKLPSWFYFYKTWDKSFGEELKDPQVWDPSHYDGDSSL
jgi:hypothetical protein